jgi:hypothetical protein
MHAIMRTIFAATTLAVVGLAGRAHAQHSGDIELDVLVANGPIVTSGGDYTGTYAGRVFEGVMPSITPLETDAPGFDSLNGTFPANAQIRFDFVKQLLYWNGTALTTPASSLTVSYGSSKTATIGGGDTAGLPGFVIAPADSAGAFHKHMFFSLPDGAAAGLYGAVMTLGPGPGATGFTTSDSYLVAFSNGSFLDQAAGLDAMVDVAFAPVPEPSTWVLAGTGLAAAVWRAFRRKRNPVA